MKLFSNLKPSPANNEDNMNFDDDDDDDASSSSSDGSDDSSSSSSGQEEDDELLGSGKGKSSSYEEDSSSGGMENNNGGVDADVAHVVKMIRKESADVDMWREIATGMLVITAAMVTVTTYILLSRQEVQEFSAGFSDIAENVQSTLDYNQHTLMISFQGLSDFMTSVTLALNATWPLVTMPDFGLHARHVRALTRTPALWSAPIVTGQAMRADWQAYVQEQASKLDNDVAEQIYKLDDNMTAMVPVVGEGPFAPAWQQSPGPGAGRGGGAVNWDVLSFDSYNDLSQIVSKLNVAVLSDILTTIDPMTSTYLWDELWESSAAVSGVSRRRRHRHHRREAAASSTVEENDHVHQHEEEDSASSSGTCGTRRHYYDTPPPMSTYLQPVFDVFDESSRVTVAYILASFDWECSMLSILHEEQYDVDIVLSDCHGDQYTWTLQGQDVLFQGKGDMHDEVYGKYQASMKFAPYSNWTDAEQNGACIFVIDVYPTQALREKYHTNKPAIYTGCVGAIFFLMAFTIMAYDRFVKRRNDKIIDAASRSHAILSSLFPSQVRDRLYDDAKKAKDKDNQATQGWVASAKSTGGLKGFLSDQGDNSTPFGDEVDQELFFDTKPLADLFPECTVLFADLAGFTAWSSVREPSQVFQLLETIYRAMDQIARRRRIFKVETVGDCYVAVCGLPDPRKDHAVAMVRFAKDCVYKVDELTNKLEVALGPDTADLTIRVGIHSGPVTAGVLRGEKSRFQLFGDTVNTAARMESTGVPGRIHVSEETAALIKEAGKGHWVTPRAGTVCAKGKGILSTYFVSISASNKKSSRSSETSSRNEGETNDASTSHESSSQNMKTLLCEKTTRLIEWNVDVLLRLLKEIAAHRQALGELDSNDSAPFAPPCEIKSSKRAIDEVNEIIALPEFNPEMIRMKVNCEEVELDESVAAQLRNYVTNIAVMYRDNNFHNFEHASHVTMSVTKLLSRIVAPSELLDELEASDAKKKKMALSLHDHTYGITSDPLTQFSCVLSALIHDVDHAGVPNSQLCIENKTLADVYQGKSVAEQNSLDLSWDMLMDDQFADLRAAIYTTEMEHQRFRSLVVQSVMATDIMDKDLKAARNDRWKKAFTEDCLAQDVQTVVNRKATIVIEHLIQASDVAHTMQHWHVYRKWNERLFREMWAAYKAGRSDKNPAEFWYQGEIGFFDFYIIPLAKKLKECGVFGVSSDEYLNYATKNRAEWELKGQDIVASMVECLLHTKP